MLTDAREIQDGTVRRADVCVVGAGAAGISLARRLRGSGREVLLLESGGFDEDESTTALNEGGLTGETMRFFASVPHLDFMRLRWFGGTTNHWGGWCHPISPETFDVREHITDSGWPFGADHLDPWYREAQRTCQLGPYRYDAAFWSERGEGEPVLDLPSFRATQYQLSPPTRFGEVYRDELVGAPDVEVCLWANAVDLEVDEERVRRVHVATLTGRRFAVEADTVVLATGAVEAARLLLASTGRRPAGVGNEHDLVGRYFADHPHLGFGAVLLPPHGDLDFYGLHERDVSDLDVGRDILTTVAGMAVEPAAAAEHDLPGMVAVVNPMVPDPTPDALVGVKDVTTLLGAVEGSTPGKSGVATVIVEQRPNPDSRVRLVGERDALGLPRVEVDWRLSAADREGMARGVELLAIELASTNLGRFQVEVDGATAADRDVDVGFHHTGTARMHTSPRRGVVDGDGRVHSVRNLYVTGGAVVPAPGWAHPTLTVVALATRLADHLAGGRP